MTGTVELHRTKEYPINMQPSEHQTLDAYRLVCSEFEGINNGCV